MGEKRVKRETFVTNVRAVCNSLTDWVLEAREELMGLFQHGWVR